VTDDTSRGQVETARVDGSRPEGMERSERFVAWAKSVAPGIAIALAIAIAARLAAPIMKPLPDVILALAAGMVIRNTIRSAVFAPGAKFVTHYVLRGSIVLIGASFTLAAAADRGWSALGLIVGLVVFAFLLGLALTRLTKLPTVLGILVGAGTAICGASAILVISPIVRAKASETAYAVATIFTFNLLAMLTYPIVGHLLNLDQTTFGTWVGTAVNDTSVVIATGFAYGHAAGATATIIKLTRTVLLLPLAVLVSVSYGMQRDGDASRFAGVRKAIPWFILGFIALAGVRTTGLLPPEVLSMMAAVASFGIVMVLASVGLNVDLRGLARMGPKALVVGLVLGAVMSVVSLSAILALNL
jgi:uncharacterized integral membrane protein (TIGR00698 family)